MVLYLETCRTDEGIFYVVLEIIDLCCSFLYIKEPLSTDMAVPLYVISK